MSENANAPQTPQNAPTEPAKSDKPKRKRSTTNANPLGNKTAFSVTDLARARLRKRGIKSDEHLADECKVTRGILRRNWTAVCKNDAAVRKAKDAPNDRKPWPTNMNRKTADLVVNAKRS